MMHGTAVATIGLPDAIYSNNFSGEVYREDHADFPD
jgi:hypothetical protein